jgi:hypothetical protein
MNQGLFILGIEGLDITERWKGYGRLGLKGREREHSFRFIEEEDEALCSIGRLFFTVSSTRFLALSLSF